MDQQKIINHFGIKPTSIDELEFEDIMRQNFDEDEPNKKKK